MNTNLNLFEITLTNNKGQFCRFRVRGAFDAISRARGERNNGCTDIAIERICDRTGGRMGRLDWEGNLFN